MLPLQLFFYTSPCLPLFPLFPIFPILLSSFALFPWALHSIGSSSPLLPFSLYNNASYHRFCRGSWSLCLTRSAQPLTAAQHLMAMAPLMRTRTGLTWFETEPTDADMVHPLTLFVHHSSLFTSKIFTWCSATTSALLSSPLDNNIFFSIFLYSDTLIVINSLIITLWLHKLCYFNSLHIPAYTCIYLHIPAHTWPSVCAIKLIQTSVICTGSWA